MFGEHEQHRLLYQILKVVVEINHKVDALIGSNLPQQEIDELTAKLKASADSLEQAIQQNKPGDK